MIKALLIKGNLVNNITNIPTSKYQQDITSFLYKNMYLGR